MPTCCSRRTASVPSAATTTSTASTSRTRWRSSSAARADRCRPTGPRPTRTASRRRREGRAAGLLVLGIRSREGLRELVAGVDVELHVDVAEVVLDRLGAEEQRRGGLARRLARGEQEPDLQLLGRERVDRAWLAPAQRLARGRELRAGAVGPRPRVEALERLPRRAPLLAGAHPLARATQSLAVGQPRARRLEAVRGPRVLGERGLEAGREVVVDHRPGAQPPRE